MKEQKATLVAYLKMKTDEGDWLSVAAAAADLRILEAVEKRSPQFIVQAGTKVTRDSIEGKDYLIVTNLDGIRRV